MQSMKLRDSAKGGATSLTQVDSGGRGGTRRRFRHQVDANTRVARQLESGDTSSAPGCPGSETTKSNCGHVHTYKGSGVETTKVTATLPVKERAAARAKNLGEVGK